MKLSVIIPTHKRPAILRECLRRLERQTVCEQMEVIVVSDGHDPATVGEMENGKWKMENEIGLGVQFIEIPKSHQGVARNRGVAIAKGDIVLFIGDDIFLEPDCCEKHINAHIKKYEQNLQSKNIFPFPFSIFNLPRAVLGHTTWDPALKINDVMLWLEHSGWQFGYPQIERYKHQFLPTELQHHFSYTSNISLPRETAKAHPFLEEVTLYGWEDMEWGLRLAKAGVRLMYEPDAKALHHHHMTVKQSLKRMETLGRSAVVMDQLNPNVHAVPRGLRLLKHRIVGLLPTMAGQHAKAFLNACRSA